MLILYVCIICTSSAPHCSGTMHDEIGKPQKVGFVTSVLRVETNLVGMNCLPASPICAVANSNFRSLSEQTISLIRIYCTADVTNYHGTVAFVY
jgi:hypothetical protein